jgi:hypothetical protein
MERKELIMNDYRSKGYTTSQVARVLGISRRTMYNFLDNKTPAYKNVRYESLIRKLKPLHDMEYLTLEPLNSEAELIYDQIKEMK